MPPLDQGTFEPAPGNPLYTQRASAASAAPTPAPALLRVGGRLDQVGVWTPPGSDGAEPVAFAPSPPGRKIDGAWTPLDVEDGAAAVAPADVAPAAAAPAAAAPRTPSTGAALGTGAVPEAGTPPPLPVPWVRVGDTYITGELEVGPRKFRSYVLAENTEADGAWTLTATTATGQFRGRATVPHSHDTAELAQVFATDLIRTGWTDGGCALGIADRACLVDLHPGAFDITAEVGEAIVVRAWTASPVEDVVLPAWMGDFIVTSVAGKPDADGYVSLVLPAAKEPSEGEVILETDRGNARVRVHVVAPPPAE